MVVYIINIKNIKPTTLYYIKDYNKFSYKFRQSAVRRPKTLIKLIFIEFLFFIMFVILDLRCTKV